ncbi:MAG: hypothetical protein HY897_16925 [Deltaproteobacteria bacterium]|nr:hypothetical protein [Deltaproteobacteria bacterium]
MKRFCESKGNRTWQRALLDQALCWPTDMLVDALPVFCNDAWSRERAMALLVLRFGRTWADDWIAWEGWFRRQSDARKQRIAELRALVEKYPAELLILWCEEHHREQDPDVAAELNRRGRQGVEGLDRAQFVADWQAWLTPQEAQLLCESAMSPAPLAEPVEPATPQAPAASVSEPEPAAPPSPPPIIRPAPRRPPPVVSVAAKPPPERPAWREEFQTFLAKNWYIAAGLAMVVVGASLLTYFTWDKHWLLRYTVAPSLLALFTLALPYLAGRIEARFEALRSTTILLRGAAVGLLPLNFMAIGLLTRDGEVTHKAVSVPIIAAVYLLVFGVALSRWCRAVHKEIAAVGTVSLLGLNSLVWLLPALSLAPWFDQVGAGVVLAAGHYTGFILAAAGITWFSRRVLTREMSDTRAVPWFFNLAVAGTFIEVFAWGHWSFREVPQPEVYAMLAILAGGLAVFTERRYFKLGSAAPGYGNASFLGYALVLLGVVMGMGNPVIRIATLAAAGVVWLMQASMRTGGLHYTIGLTMLMLGAASAALLDQFPKGADVNLLPALGLAVALAFRAVHATAGRLGRSRLVDALESFSPGILVLTAVTAVLSQWYYHSEPRQIGVALVVVGGLFAWRAERTGSSHWVYTAMAIFAMGPAYFGCVDMRAHALYGNNLVFGLAVLLAIWLAVLAVRPTAPWMQARSTVALSIGGFALAAMILRVIIEQGHAGEGLGIRAALDIAGPFLMALALVFVTYYSRSLIAAGLALVIVVVLLPELKESLKRLFPLMTWGSGLGSASWGLALVLLVFPLQRWKRLADLGPGDRSFDGGAFPFVRPDHTLFTWPLLTAALFLTAKVDTWNLARNYLGTGVGIKTAIALGITACAWQLLAAGIRSQVFGWIAAFLTAGTLLLCFHFLNPLLFIEPQHQLVFLFTGVILTILAALYHLISTRSPVAGDVLQRPGAAIVREGCWIGAGFVSVLFLGGVAFDELHLLGAFLLFLLVWHGLRGGGYHFGSIAFLLGAMGILAHVSPGEGMLVDRLTFEKSLGPMLYYALAIQLVHLALELRQTLHARLKCLLMPVLVGSTTVVAGAAALTFWHLLDAPTFEITMPEQVMAVILILLTARIFVSAEITLVAAALVYVVVQTGELAGLAPGLPRVELLLMPWRLAAFGMALAIIPHAGRFVRRFLPTLAHSRQPLLTSGLQAESAVFPAAIIASIVSLIHFVSDPVLRHEPLQLWAPYLATAALLAVAFTWRHLVMFAAASVALSIGNVQAVDTTLGERLIAWDLSHFHTVCLGLIATLFQGTLARLILPWEEARRRITEGCLVVAGLVLLLLSLNYFAHPNLEAMSLQRFAISGMMALVAGLYYRRAARRPPAVMAGNAWLLEGVYHFGLAVMMWCFALMIPALRSPHTALVAIGLPPLYFYLRAEIGAHVEHGERYRDSSVILCFLVLALFTFKGIFHLILFPETPVDTHHYHLNAPVVFAAGLVLLRLHGLGATFWSAAYGGLALAAGVYFSVTGFPGLSPFEHPVPAAWAAIVLAHLFIMAGAGQSPFRRLVQATGRIEEKVWHNLRSIWGNVLLAGAAIVVAFGLHDAWHDETYMVAPILLGAATLFVHQGVAGHMWPYHVTAGVLAALALHADFLVPSYLDREYVAAVLIGLWATFTAGDRLWARVIGRPVLFGISALFLAGAIAHVLYHRPWSIGGLAALSLAGLLWALAVRDEHEPSNDLDPLAAGSLLLWPPALLYFSQVYGLGRGAQGLLKTWPILTGIAAVLGIAWLARLSQEYWAAEFARVRGRTPRLINQTLTVLGRHGLTIQAVLTWCVCIVSAVILVAHYERAYSHREIALFSLVWIGLAAAWIAEGSERPSMVATVAVEACLLGLFILARRQMVLTVGWWMPQYDVWAALAVSAGLTGVKGWLDDRDESVKLPLKWTMHALPALAIGWTLFHELGSNVALVVIGLQSVLYAFLGRKGRDSKYNIVAIGGFTAFIVILFWSKLELRVVQAYVLPVGVGVLTLVQLFSSEIPPATRMFVRASTLLAMIGSAGYYALLDGAYPVAFNAVLIGVGLAAMLVGTVLKVRLYIALGFLGILVDLCSILYKTIVLMESAYRMTVIGVLLLLVGIVVVGGSIYYKARAGAAEEWLNRLRAKMEVWE